MQFTKTFGYPTDVVAERFWAKVEKTDGCWLWTGMKTGKQHKYGQMRVKPKGPWALMVAHRIAYLLERGEIPTGLTLDHTCSNTLCVRPDHLEPVTLGENVERTWKRDMSASCRKCGEPMSPKFTFCRPCWQGMSVERRAAISAAFEPGKTITGQTNPAYWAAIEAASA